jgi:hypothetical protein
MCCSSPVLELLEPRRLAAVEEETVGVADARPLKGEQFECESGTLPAVTHDPNTSISSVTDCYNPSSNDSYARVPVAGNFADFSSNQNTVPNILPKNICRSNFLYIKYYR